MPRYTRQFDSVSCGPVCLINCLKWAGIPATTASHLPFLQFGCRTIDMEDPTNHENNGTTDHDFDRVLRYVGKGTFKVRRKKHPSLKEIKAHLKKGGSVAIGYHWEEDGQTGDHFMFLSGLNRGQIVCVNDHRSTTENTISRRTDATMSKWLVKAPGYPYAWFLTKDV